MKHIPLVLLLSLLVGIPLQAATYKTQNFVVSCPDDNLCQQCCKVAEQSRKEIAMLWLGRELPNWQKPCPVNVVMEKHSGGGATSFGFGGGEPDMRMRVEGPPDKILSSVLPHEVCHTVLATYFRGPTPRCFDEGISVCSECPEERQRHDKLCRNILNAGRAIQLRALFPMTEYPQDVMCVYAQGYSVCSYLLTLKSRSTLLSFIAAGKGGNWDNAARSCYGFNDVASLEKSWLDHLKQTKNSPPDNGGTLGQAEGTASPPVAGGVRPIGPVNAADNGTAPTNPTSSTLSRIEAKLDQLVGLKEDVEGLKKRVAALERELQGLKGNSPAKEQPPAPPVSSINIDVKPVKLSTPPEGIIQDIPGWNRQPQRMPQGTASPPVSAPPSRTPWVQGFDRPNPVPYSQPFSPGNSYGQPYCPPGGT